VTATFESQAKWRLLTRRDFANAFTSWSAGEASAAGFVNASASVTNDSINRVKAHITSGLEFEHGTDRKTPRGNVYRPYRLTIAEAICGVIVLRASEAFRVCEIDVFLTAELPGLERGATTRAALLFALSDAVRNGGSMALQFTPSCCGGAVPAPVTDLAQAVDVPLGSTYRGAIAPEEARQLYLRLTGLSDKARERALELSRRGFFSPERIAFFVATGIWSAAEAEMLLLACPYPDLLFGAGIQPESRHLYAIALTHGRSAVLSGIVERAFRYQDGSSDERADGVAVNPRPVFLNIPVDPIPSVMGYLHGPLPQDRTWEGWSPNPPEVIRHRTGQRILVIPRPRGREETRLFLTQDLDAARDAGAAARAKAALVYSAEFLELNKSERIEVTRYAGTRSVDILVCPENLTALEAETERRLREGRKLRS